MSNALRKSQKMASETFLLFEASVTLFKRCIIGWTVLCFFLNPNWFLLIKLFDSRKTTSRLHIIFSSILEKALNREMGR